VRAPAGRRVDTKELAAGSEAAAARTDIGDARARALGAHGDGADETAWERETTETREERRRGKVARRMAAQTAARAPGSGVSGTAARDTARSERALGKRKEAGKARAKRKRQEARAQGREAGEVAGSGAAAVSM
jgi:hypothetical protein